eukprot:scaffold364690_cov53-Attheya_sp.AAC.1
MWHNSLGLWPLLLLIVVRPSTSFSSKRLSSRLEEVFHLCSSAITTTTTTTTTKPIVVADIGADHAQLSLALVQKGVADRAIAIDRCRSPLEMGQENARKATLFDRMDFRLGNGLEPLRPTDGVHVVCVAGMGARTIAIILQQQGVESSSSLSTGSDNQHTASAPSNPALGTPARQSASTIHDTIEAVVNRSELAYTQRNTLAKRETFLLDPSCIPKR